MPSHKGRILYTKNDADSRNVLACVFALSGSEVVCAESGPKARHLAKREQFDLFPFDNWIRSLTWANDGN